MRIRMDWTALRFDWTRARAFLVTAEEGSLSAAARALGLTQPTVGRQVAAFEAEMGVTVFERVAGRLELTSAGTGLLEHVRHMGEGALGLSLAAAGQATAIEGRVTITASETVAAFLLPPVIASLRAEHPGIEIEVVASIAIQDLRRREADIALRNGRPKDPELIGRVIREDRAGFYATPAWIAAHGPFDTPADLARLEVFAFDRSDALVTGFKHLGVDLSQATFPIISGNHLVQWAMCRQGLGVCVMMDIVGDADPTVDRLFANVSVPVPTWLVCHRELRTSRRIRLVFDRLAQMLGQDSKPQDSKPQADGAG
ncbi:MAG: DNA-binding transcriptional LysR family regulator [Bradymonadia bacterium]|jgi:DNA-binding transcriptional LysR family regulator